MAIQCVSYIIECSFRTRVVKCIATIDHYTVEAASLISLIRQTIRKIVLGKALAVLYADYWCARMNEYPH